MCSVRFYRYSFGLGMGLKQVLQKFWKAFRLKFLSVLQFQGNHTSMGLFLCPLLLHHADLKRLRKGLSIRSQRARQLHMIFELPHRNRVILKCSWAKPEFMAVEILKGT